MSTVEAAVEAIRGGRLALIPTDTVYGLATSPYSEAPVRRLYRAKGRDDVQPTALVAADLDVLFECVPELRRTSRRDRCAPCCPARSRSCSRTPRAASAGSRGRAPRRSACACRSWPAQAARCWPGWERLPRRAPTSQVGPTRARSTTVPEALRERSRGDRRRRRAAGHAVDRDRLHRRCAGGAARGRGVCCRRAPGRQLSALASSRPRGEEERHGRRPGNARPASQRRPRRRRSRHRGPARP